MAAHCLNKPTLDPQSAARYTHHALASRTVAFTPLYGLKQQLTIFTEIASRVSIADLCHKSITHVSIRETFQLVANLLATSRCNGIMETTRHNRHSGLLPSPTCYRLPTGRLV